MTRYYSVILGINVFIGLFYFYMRRNWGISPKILILISAVSVFTGMIFPVILGHSSLMMAIAANIVLLGIGTYYIMGLISDQNSDEAVSGSTSEPVDSPVPEDGRAMDQSAPAAVPEKNMNEDEKSSAETAVALEEEETIEEETMEEETMEEETIEEENIEEETIEEEGVEEESVEEETVKEEIDNDETVADKLAEEFMADDEESFNDLQGVETMSVVNNLSFEEDSFDLRDSYIIRGFDAKAERKLELAVKYFSSALELNPPADLEFMLITDICAMLEELGQYRRAQENLGQFIYERPDLSGEILNELHTLQKTLEILQETLAKANTPNMPLSVVPALIRVSVEEKVNQWKNEVL